MDELGVPLAPRQEVCGWGRAHPVVNVHLVVEEEDDEFLLVARQRHPVRHLLHRELQGPLLAGWDGRKAAHAVIRPWTRENLGGFAIGSCHL